MDYRNADGSLAEMCGNGARCVGKLVHDLGLSADLEFTIQTMGGLRRLRLHDDEGEVHRVTVEMGVPGFTKASIPMRGPAWETFLGEPFDVGGGMTLKASAVSMGNPHLVLFVEDDPDRFHVGHIGPALERHELFPEGTNVEFAQVLPGRDQGARMGARLGRDDGVRERRVRGRGGGERGRSGAGRDGRAVPRRCARGRTARERRGAPDRRGPSGSSRAWSTWTVCGAVPARDRRRRAPRPRVGERLAARTLDLVNIASVSGDEAAILASIAAALPEGLDVVDRAGRRPLRAPVRATG